MSQKTNDKSSSLNTWVNIVFKIVLIIVVIISLGAVGSLLILKLQTTDVDVAIEKRQPKEETRPTIPWHRVNADIEASLRQAEANAKRVAELELARWTKEMEQRIDNDFLKWYFGYWRQNWMGIKALGYTITDIFREQPIASERFMEEIQVEFAQRVIRPQIAQMQLKRITNETVKIFLEHFQQDLRTIAERYAIPEPDWNSHLQNVALLTKDVNVGRNSSIQLNRLVALGSLGSLALVVQSYSRQGSVKC